MSNREVESTRESEIADHQDVLRPLCDEGDRGGGGGGGGRGERRLKEIKKKVKQLLCGPVRKTEAIDGQSPRRRKQNKHGEEVKQQRWPSKLPSLGYSYSFTVSGKGWCVPHGAANHSRGSLKSTRKSSNYQLFLKSIIEKNDFYSKECNAHSS